MRRNGSLLVPALACAAVALGGCASEGGGTGAVPTADAGDAVLATADSDLGEIVVDAEGRTVYVFDRDTPGSGESACSGPCLEAWPPVVVESEDPRADAVAAELGTIARDDGTLQLTLAGKPLYYWQGDAAPGDTTGQGVQDVWWVVTPDGTEVTATPARDPGY